MRTNGVDERFCTGKDTTDWEKFEKWAETVPYTFRNPLYHWTHLELKTAFGIDKILNPKTAREIYEEPKNLFVAGFIGEINMFNATVIERLDEQRVRANVEGRECNIYVNFAV